MKRSSDFGLAFGEELRGEGHGEEKEFASARLRFFWISLIVVFGALFFRLVWLQLVEGGKNRIRSEENRILARRVPAPRGVIKDRNGEILAQNIPVYKIQNPECAVVAGNGGGGRGGPGLGRFPGGKAP